MNAKEEAGAFFGFLDVMAKNCQRVGRTLADDLGVPYMADCEADGPRGPRKELRRKDGTVYGSDTGDLLPGSVNNAPDCHLNVPEALRRFGSDKLVGIYFHIPSLTLTLVGLSGAKIGVRSIDLARGRSLLVSELGARSGARGQA